MEDANIMKARKYVKGYEQKDIVGLDRETIGDFVQVQTMVDYDTEHFKYTDFNDPLYMYQDPLFPTFDIILDTEYSPLLSTRQGISSIQSFLNDYSLISGIGTRQKIYDEFKKTLYKLFNSGFRDIDRNKSYYINSIAGLDKMTAKIVDYEKDNITITMNEDVSMITTYLSQLYNNLSYSYKDQRYMFPANLLRFNMYIKIHDVRNMVDLIPKFKPHDSSSSSDNYIESYNKSYQIYYLQDCTFNFFKSKFFEDNITVGGFDVSNNTTAASIKLEITYKSISIESGFPLIKNAITDTTSSALTLQNKAQSIESSLNNNNVFINNQKSVEAFRDEIETLKSPSLNNNDPSNNTGDLMDSEIDLSAMETYYQVKDNMRLFAMLGMHSGIEGDVNVAPGSVPRWKSAGDSDTTYDVYQTYREDLISPENAGRPYEGDVQVYPGYEPRWYISDTAAPEVSAIKQSVLNQINLGGFLQTLPFAIIDMFMGGYHGMQDDYFLPGYGPDVIYAPRGAENYIGGGAFNLPELNGDIIPDYDAQTDLNRLNQDTIPEYPIDGQLLPDPNILNGETMPTDPIVVDPFSLEGDIIPGSIILPGGVFSDPTVLHGENLNFQIPQPEFLEGLFIPMSFYKHIPLEGSIQMDWNEKKPLEGTIEMSFFVKDPLEGFIEMTFKTKDELEGVIDTSFYTKDPLEGTIDTSIKPKLQIEGNISQEVREKEPLDVRIDNTFNEREYLNLIKPVYNIPIKSPLSGYVDMTTRDKPDFDQVFLYEYPNFERIVDMGSLYLNITEENIMPIIQLYSKVESYKSLVDYYLYNKVVSEAKAPNVSIIQTIKEKSPLNLIYSYNNEIDIPKTMENVRLYNNDVNKVNNMIVNYVFGEYPVKPEIEEVRLYNNTIIPVLMPEVYLYDKGQQKNYLTETRLYQMVINEFGNSIPNGLSIDTTTKEKEFVYLGDVIEDAPEKKEVILPLLYEPVKEKKLIERVILYSPAEKADFEPSKLYEKEEYYGNIFKPNLSIEETKFEEFGKRLENVKIDQDTIVLKKFPYTTMSYKPLYEIEDDNNKRDKTLDKERLDVFYTYKRPLKEEYITIKPIMDKDSELAIKLEGDRINTEKRERTNKEEYEYNVASLSDEDRIGRKKIVDEYEPPRKNPDGVEIDQTLTYKAPFKETFIGKPEDKPVPEDDSTLKGQRVDMPIREKDPERMGNVFDDDPEVKDREYLVDGESLDYNNKPRKVLVAENLDSQVRKKANLDGESLDHEPFINTEMPVENIDSEIKEKKYLNYEALDYDVRPDRALTEEYIDENTQKPKSNLDGERLDLEDSVERNLNGEVLDYEIKNKANLTYEKLDYELPMKRNLNGEVLDYEIRPDGSLNGEVLDYEIKPDTYLNGEVLDYEIGPDGSLNGEVLDYELKQKGSLNGEILDYELKPEGSLNGEVLDYELKPDTYLNGEVLDYELKQKGNLNGEVLDYELKQKGNLNGEVLDYELKPEGSLNGEVLDYELKQKGNLNGEVLDYEIRPDGDLNGEVLDYEIKIKGNLNGEVLDYEIKPSGVLNGEVLDYELKQKGNLNGEVLDYELKQKGNLNGEILDYEIRQKAHLNGEILDIDGRVKKYLMEERLDYGAINDNSLNGERLDYETPLNKSLNGENLTNQ